MRRRWILAPLPVLGLAALWLTLPACIHTLGGAWSADPARLAHEARPATRAVLERALADLDPERLTDVHVHALGLGTGGSGCWMNPEKLTWRHPWPHLQFRIFASAAGIDELERADQEYLERLLALVRGMDLPGARYHLLAFDRHYDAAGAPDDEHTELYVPDDYVVDLCERYGDAFLPTGSVHPYRKDALDELDRLAARGVRWIKWLPGAMGIDPADARCDPFYERMAAHDMVLLSHAGRELAVDASEMQALGNPLRLRRPLDRGVRVVVAHCASLGKDQDLDDPERPKVESFELFLRLMDERRYEGRLFGEISAVTQINRMQVLARLLERADLHARLVNGSDYPLPAVNAAIWTNALQSRGFLTAEERLALNEVYEFNPLLFDLALKRTVHHPKTGARFPASVFYAHPGLEG